MRKINICLNYLNGQELYGIRDESLKISSGKDNVDYIDIEVKEMFPEAELKDLNSEESHSL